MRKTVLLWYGLKPTQKGCCSGKKGIVKLFGFVVSYWQNVHLISLKVKLFANLHTQNWSEL
jgi:hypothetical protein